eukprot:scaffold11054_cov93-Cyclotella_meneghiniana.AAC.1
MRRLAADSCSFHSSSTAATSKPSQHRGQQHLIQHHSRPQNINHALSHYQRDIESALCVQMLWSRGWIFVFDVFLIPGRSSIDRRSSIGPDWSN